MNQAVSPAHSSPLLGSPITASCSKQHQAIDSREHQRLAVLSPFDSNISCASTPSSRPTFYYILSSSIRRLFLILALHSISFYYCVVIYNTNQTEYKIIFSFFNDYRKFDITQISIIDYSGTAQIATSCAPLFWCPLAKSFRTRKTIRNALGGFCNTGAYVRPWGTLIRKSCWTVRILNSLKVARGQFPLVFRFAHPIFVPIGEKFLFARVAIYAVSLYCVQALLHRGMISWHAIARNQ